MKHLSTSRFFLPFILLAFVFIIPFCKKEDTAKVGIPTKLKYATSSVKSNFGKADSSVVPSISWNNEKGKFALISSTDGISINANTGKIFWTAKLPVGTYKLKLKASNSAGLSDTANYIIEIISSVPSGLTYADINLKAIVGTAGSSATPSINAGGASISYAISGNTDAGISIASSTGVISWTNAVAVGTYNLVVTPNNTSGGGVPVNLVLTVGLNTSNTSLPVIPDISNETRLSVVPTDITTDSILKIVYQPSRLIQFQMKTDGKLRIIHMGVEPLNNDTITARIKGIANPLRIAVLKSLTPLSVMEASISLLAGKKYQSIANEAVVLPEGLKPSDVTDIQFLSSDPIYAKLKTIKTSWVFHLMNFGSFIDNWEDINPVHIKWMIRYYTNLAYAISQAGFVENMYKTFITNNDKIAVDNATKDIIYQHILAKKDLENGVVMNVSGLGAGLYGSLSGRYGLAAYIINRQWLIDYGFDAALHEFGHVDGFSHSSTMTYPYSKDTLYTNPITNEKTLYSGVYKGFATATQFYFNEQFVKTKNIPYPPTATAKTAVVSSQTGSE